MPHRTARGIDELDLRADPGCGPRQDPPDARHRNTRRRRSGCHVDGAVRCRREKQLVVVAARKRAQTLQLERLSSQHRTARHRVDVDRGDDARALQQVAQITEQGLQLASAMEASEPQARLTAMSASAPPRPTSTPTIRTAELPPSVPGTSYTPPPITGDPAPAPSRVAEAATAVRPDQRLASPPSAVALPAAPPLPGPAQVASVPPSDDGLRPGLSASLGSNGSAPQTTAPAASPPVRTAGAPSQAPAVARPPAPRPAPPAATAAATGGSWRIQLGAFGNRRGAEARWARIASRLTGATPSYTAVGTLTRLQAGGYPNRAAATRACAAVRAESPDCFAVGG